MPELIAAPAIVLIFNGYGNQVLGAAIVLACGVVMFARLRANRRRKKAERGQGPW